MQNQMEALMTLVSNSHKTSAPAAADITVVNSGPPVKLVLLTELDDVGF